MSRQALQALRALGPIDLRNVRRDSLLRWMAFMPFFLALMLRLIVPWVQAGLMERFAFDLTPYYILVMSYGFVLAPPTLFGVVIGFLLLDERDDDTLTALQVTPLPLSSYLAYRVAIPITISVVLTMLAFPLAGLATFPPHHLFFVALLAAPFAPIFALFLAAFAKNKVQGFALMKGSGIFLIAPLAAYFISSGWNLAFGLIPTYWPVKLYWVLEAGATGAWFYMAAGLLYEGLLLKVLLDRFNKVLHR